MALTDVGYRKSLGTAQGARSTGMDDDMMSALSCCLVAMVPVCKDEVVTGTDGDDACGGGTVTWRRASAVLCEDGFARRSTSTTGAPVCSSLAGGSTIVEAPLTVLTRATRSAPASRSASFSRRSTSASRLSASAKRLFASSSFSRITRSASERIRSISRRVAWASARIL
eukprot:scaffold188659_cov30-Tisochrysis_lutea.AAC.3